LSLGFEELPVVGTPISRSPGGLGIVAVGLFAFGIYSVIEGVYRRIDNPAVGARLRATA